VDYNKAKTESTGLKFLSSVGGFKRKGQIRNTKIREDLTIFNLNNNITKPISQWKHHVQRLEGRRIPKKIITHNPKRKQNIPRPELRWKDQHTLQEDGTGHVWPNR
jgi:hypothetical protein